MKLLQIIKCIIAVITVIAASADAQQFTNFNVWNDEDTLYIGYDIVGCQPQDILEVECWLSKDGGQTQNMISAAAKGDYGIGVTPGEKRLIKWLPLNENIELSGENVVFMLNGKVLGTAPEPEFVLIKGGSFMMGDPNAEGLSDANNLHLVKLNDYEISQYEVTNLQFANFIRNYGSIYVQSGEHKGELMVVSHNNGLTVESTEFKSFCTPSPGRDHYPAVNITWYGANEYCRFYGYRLPSEAEWEYAAKQRGDSLRFSGIAKAHPDRINFNTAAEGPMKASEYTLSGIYRGTPARVCSFPPNNLKLFEMSGNVWEWCADWYESNYYFHSKTDNPSGPWFGTRRVMRGGSWYTSSFETRSSMRYSMPPEYYSGDVGFRVVRDVTQK